MPLFEPDGDFFVKYNVRIEVIRLITQLEGDSK